MLGVDQSDLAKNCRAHCHASLPDPKTKALVWEQITDPGNPDSSIVKAAKMTGFASKEQIDLLEPYFDKFFDTLVLQSKMSSYKSLCSFFHAMLPRLSVKDDYIFRLYQLLYDTPDSQGPFQSTLKDGIDILFRTQRIV